MRYLHHELPKNQRSPEWFHLFHQAMLKRRRPPRLVADIKKLRKTHDVEPREMACILLAFRAANGGADDPLLFRYVEHLLKERHFNSSQVLHALLVRSTYGAKEPTAPNTRCGMPTLEERIFNVVTQYHMATDLPLSPVALHDLIQIITRWLKQVSEEATSRQLRGHHAMDVLINGLYEALGVLAITVLGNQGIRAVMKQKWWKQRRATVVTEMENYDTHVLRWMNSQQLTGRLRQLTGIPPFLEIDESGRPKFSNEQILATVPELPVNRSRAGIFIWLSAALAARPLTDDMTILSYLQGRYPDDPQSLIVDLLVASFDVLTNIMLTKESRQSVKVVRSFICNKVPILIAMLSGQIQPPLSAENSIQMAMIPGGMISMDPLPPITPGATDLRDSLKATRLDFLQACALHGLVTEGAVASILQESVALPRVSKLNKDTLVAQSSNNTSKLGELIEELAGMQGNTGAIAGCVVESVNNLCLSKDTMSLKSVCDKLVRRIPYMDFVLQYAHPGMLLLPLCNLLNEWVQDQDQTEFTPAYEEFASILLLTLAIIHRYALVVSDIGILGDSFVARLLDEGTHSKLTSELPSEQGAQLSKWIDGLFAVDEHGETSGISDDVMRQCSPQSFYMLVPTLFEQSILACRLNVLSMKTFKGGLELLLEPFLLPSLVMGLGWLAEHLRKDHDDTNTLLQILEKLLKPTSIAQETQAMHRAVLAIVATDVYDSLQECALRQPKNKQVTELLGLLRPHLNQQRTLRARKDELNDWTQGNGSLEELAARSIRDLTTWASTSSNPPDPPPRYIHRTFALACQTLSADVLLPIMVQEINNISFSNVPVVLDICTSLICAPVAVPVGAQQSSHSASPMAKLRDSARHVLTNAQSLLDQAESVVQTLVRLGRRVDAQLAVAQLPQIVMPISMPEQATDQMMQDLGLAMDGDAPGGGDATMNQNTDLSGIGQPLDMARVGNGAADDLMAGNSSTMDLARTNQLFADLMESSNAQPDSQPMSLSNPEDDIFAGLTMDMDIGDDFNFA